MKRDKLTPADLEWLAQSWISPELAEHAHIHRVDGFQGATMIGREKDVYTDRFAGLVFPYYAPFHCDGRFERGYRLWRDNPEIESGKQKNKYMSPPGQPVQFYFSPGQTQIELADPDVPFVFTEGEKKALALYRLARYRCEYPRFGVIGISGAWNWRGRVGKVQGADGETQVEKGPIPDFDHIKWNGRTVYVCFDADWRTNESVSAARFSLFKELKRRNAKPQGFDIPEEAGVKGIDDWIVSSGPDSVLQAFEKCGDSGSSLPGRFIMRDGWLYYIDDDGAVKVSSEIRVVKETRAYDSTEWGKLIWLRTPDGTEHKRIIPFQLLSGDGRECREHLSNLGLRIATDKNSGRLLIQYLNECTGDGFAYSTDKVGWNETYKHYVLPDTCISLSGAEETTFHSSVDHRFKTAGTLVEWKENVGNLCEGNSRLTLAASMAFAAPLLGLIDGTEPGGAHLVGPSSLGQSTALVVAGSVWGGGPRDVGFVRSWRRTANGLEAIAQLHNDCLLCLDEISQMEAREANEAAYLLANGHGKSRMSKSIEARKPLRWRLLFLSSGERTLSDHAGTAGKETQAGTEVRMLNIPADAGAGLGLFETLHGFSTAAEFARRVKDNALRYYGHPSREFIRWLLANMDDAVEFAREHRDEFIKVNAAGANGEVVRVAARMGLISAGGVLARSAGIWDLSQDAIVDSIKRCFRAWLIERGIGANQASDLERSIAKVRNFIEAHGSSRFLKRYCGEDEDRVVHNQAGILAISEHDCRYLIFTETFRREVCPTNYTEVAKQLYKLGILERDEKEWTVKRGKARYYSISEDILGYAGRPIKQL
jgi:uncharacterized protein (DUF927 family)